MVDDPTERGLAARLAGLGRSAIPPVPPGDGRPRPPRRLEVFGASTDWVQLTWSALGPGPVSISTADRRMEVVADGGPGAALVTGLAPGAEHRIVVDGEGVAGGTVVLAARTLEPPPGALLLRIATVSDVHVGSSGTGYFRTIVEKPPPAVPHPVRCLRAAVHELTGWGAEQLVVKGDLVDRSDQAAWDAVADVMSEVRVPVEVVPGNHERSKDGDVDPAEALAAMGITLVHGVEAVDQGGVRLLLADTTQHGTDIGSLDPVAGELLDAAASTDGPVFLALHHQPMRFRLPTYLPPGLPGPEARPFLRALGEANRRVIVTSGHTHRHRRHEVHGVTTTEVGSTKDFPGTWAGYQVHEGGVVQFVRRIAEPSCIRWTEQTRRAAGGVWSWWAPGRFEDRCFSLRW